MASFKLGSEIKLVLSDVDETIADVYTPATNEMISALSKILQKGIVLFLVSGGGLKSIQERITDKIDASLRHKILIAHCSGAEVWGFNSEGNLNPQPYYGLYDQKLNDNDKKRWREIVKNIVAKYQLKTFETMPVKRFAEVTHGDVFSIMYVDRGPQITLEFPNSYELTNDQKEYIESKLNIQIPEHEGTFDLRIPIMDDLNELYKNDKLAVKSKLSGIFALDNPIEGVDKTFAIKYVLENAKIMTSLGLPKGIENMPSLIEIWGDKFGQKKGGADFQMCRAVSPQVRSLDFRVENTQEFVPGFNIVNWDGEKRLHEGLLEYLENE